MTEFDVVLYRPGYTQIVPSQYQDEIIAIREAHNLGFWRLGDIANEIWSGIKGKDKSVSRTDVFMAVGYFYGSSASTISEYARTAEFFDHSLRTEYNMLSFGHFVLARRMCNDDTNKAIDYLEMALGEIQPSPSGVPTTVPMSINAMEVAIQRDISREISRDTSGTGNHIQKNNTDGLFDLMLVIRRIQTMITKNLTDKQRDKLNQAANLISEVLTELGG
jgi:hypothetical protein